MAQATRALPPTPDPAAVPVLLHRLSPDVGIPSPAHPGDAGVDLVTTETVELAPGERRTVGTGVAVALPDGHAAFVLPRSGLAARHGLTVVNAPGTVDAGYRGEIRVTLLNTDARVPLRLSAGDRVAQLVVLPVPRIRFVEVERLPGSARGTDGFGSTGTAATRPAATEPAATPGPRP
jgi:dUTP pyrophosphatase